MNKIEEILRKKTLEMFSDKWYELTSKELSKIVDDNYGYVYFVTNERIGSVKIGLSINLEKRLKGLKTGMADGLYLYGFIYTKRYVELEKELHKQFKDKRKQGEWFNLSKDECLNILNEKNGVVVDGYYVNNSNIIEGEFSGFKKMNSDFLDEYYSELYRYFETLQRGIKIKKVDFRKNARLVDPKVEQLSNRKITIMLKRWCELKGYKYRLFNSNGNFSFIIY